MPDEEVPTITDIYDAQEDVVQRWDLSHHGTRAVLPDRTIESVLDRASDHEETYHRAAALLRYLANAHVFEYGNKRTAVLGRHSDISAPAGVERGSLG
jgi:hypothetical protein